MLILLPLVPKKGDVHRTSVPSLICPIATVIKFKLRHGVTFSDGTPFGADDVVFSYDWVMNPQVDAPRDRQALGRLKSVVKIAEDEVAFNFREPYFQSFEVASSIDILSKAFYGKLTPAQFNDSVGLLIGTGPISTRDARRLEAHAGQDRAASQRPLLGTALIV